MYGAHSQNPNFESQEPQSYVNGLKQQSNSVERHVPSKYQSLDQGEDVDDDGMSPIKSKYCLFQSTQ